MFSLRILKSLVRFSVGVSSYRGKHSSFSLAFRVIQNLHPLPVVVVLFSPIYFSLHNAGLVDFTKSIQDMSTLLRCSTSRIDMGESYFPARSLNIPANGWGSVFVSALSFHKFDDCLSP